jgi:hypothetical protein
LIERSAHEPEQLKLRNKENSASSPKKWWSPFAAASRLRGALAEEVPVVLACQQKPVVIDADDDRVRAVEVDARPGPANPDAGKPDVPVEKIVCPGTEEYENLMRRITEESEENNLGVQKDIPALGPSLLPDEVPMPDKKPLKPVIEIDERKANAGFQNIMNAARFWKASQMIGTRKPEF